MVRLLAAVLVAAVSGPSAPSAFAKRPATAPEARAVKSAVAAYIAAPKSPAAKDNRVVSVAVSTVNPAYALARLRSATAGPSNALLHKTRTTWKVVDFGSGAFPCSDASKRVLEDLVGGCVPG